ncbi:helix-turn-helix transcriptional regulator [Eionea flava]
METLIETIRYVAASQQSLPFSVYTSVKEQHIVNVPIVKPLLICILSGNKKLGRQGEIICPFQSFVFLSNNPTIDMRNIPSDGEYFALLVEFEDSDFDCLPASVDNVVTPLIQGSINGVLENTLQQFVEWSATALPAMWHIRRQEILQVLFYLGYHQITSAYISSNISYRLHKLISQDITQKMGITQFASALAMSESTLRRKLHSEGLSFQSIKENVRLGHGLHLLQSSRISIGAVAEQCGYHSPSRFTQKFKQLFGVTPSELRKTRA